MLSLGTRSDRALNIARGRKDFHFVYPVDQYLSVTGLLRETERGREERLPFCLSCRSVSVRDWALERDREREGGKTTILFIL